MCQHQICFGSPTPYSNDLSLKLDYAHSVNESLKRHKHNSIAHLCRYRSVRRISTGEVNKPALEEDLHFQ